MDDNRIRREGPAIEVVEDDEDDMDKAMSVKEYLQKEEERKKIRSMQVQPPWPEIAPEAFFGLAGKIVEIIKPETEADPVAILLQILTMFGNAVGRHPYYSVGASRHYMNLFGCLNRAT